MIVLIGFILIAALTGCASGPTWTETERIEARLHQLETGSNVVKMVPADPIPSQNSLKSEIAISGPSGASLRGAPSALDGFMATQAELEQARREGYAQALKDTNCEIFAPVTVSEEQ